MALFFAALGVILPQRGVFFTFLMDSDYDGPIDFPSSEDVDVKEAPKKKRKRSCKVYQGDSVDKSNNYKHPRCLCITINNPTLEDYRLLEKAHKDKQFNYIIAQYERGDECGTLHIQGYIETSRKLTDPQLRKYIPRATIKHRKGTTYEAESYACDPSKRDKDHPDVIEYGQPDTTTMNNMAVYTTKFRNDAKIMSVDELKTKYSAMWLRYQKAFWETINKEFGVRLWKEHREKTKQKIKIRNVYWIYGLTGEGKSTTSMEKCWEYLDKNRLNETPVVLRCTGGSKGSIFFEEYDCETTAILDDVDPNWMGLDILKALTDQMPIKIHVKGGSRWWNVRELYITSVNHPDDLYHSNELNRRITNITKLAKPDPIEEYLPKETQPSLSVDPAKPLFDQLFKD